MRVLAENGDAARRMRLLAVATRKRRSAELRRREAEQFDAEATALQNEAEQIASDLAAAVAALADDEGAA